VPRYHLDCRARRDHSLPRDDGRTRPVLPRPAGRLFRRLPGDGRIDVVDERFYAVRYARSTATAVDAPAIVTTTTRPSRRVTSIASPELMMTPRRPRPRPPGAQRTPQPPNSLKASTRTARASTMSSAGMRKTGQPAAARTTS